MTGGLLQGKFYQEMKNMKDNFHLPQKGILVLPSLLFYIVMEEIFEVPCRGVLIRMAYSRFINDIFISKSVQIKGVVEIMRKRVVCAY